MSALQNGTGSEKAKAGWRVFLLLHIGLFVSSLSGVCSKKAALAGEFSQMLVWYGMVLALMAAYAVLWQQVLRRMPLTVAYANKPVGLVWFAWALTDGAVATAGRRFSGDRNAVRRQAVEYALRELVARLGGTKLQV